jgi:hypothetical protein
MISSDLHGAEEPIRWLLGWQRQDNIVMSPCMKKKKDVLTQDALAEPDLGGSPTADEMMAFDGQDATQGRLDVFWSMWQCAGIIWHVWQLAGALEGPTFCLLDVDLAQKGPTSPSEGPDVSLLAHNYDILAFNVTNNVTIVSQPCRLF